jgi:hypothetical protein
VEDADDLAFARLLADAADQTSLDLDPFPNNPAARDRRRRRRPMLAPNPSHRRSAAPAWGAAGLPQLPDHLLDALVSIALTGGRMHHHALHHQSLAGLLDRHLVASDDHDLVELTPLGLRVLAGAGLERIQQQAAARRGCVPTDPRGQVRWAG